jgi:glucose-1-phosphate thymidylyltransferase
LATARVTFAQQPSPDGLALAFSIGANLIGNYKARLILGDNLLHGPGVGTQLRPIAPRPRNSVLALGKVESTNYSPRDAFDALAEYVRNGTP